MYTPALNISERTAFRRQKRAETTAVPDTSLSGLTTTEPVTSKIRGAFSSGGGGGGFLKKKKKK